jgi:hypothetical protein
MDDKRSADDDLVELQQAVLDDWILVTTHAVAALDAIKQTVSWRVTAPLRLARRFGSAANEIGVTAAAELAAVAVARRLRRE